jgi:hypothetical protein
MLRFRGPDVTSFVLGAPESIDVDKFIYLCLRLKIEE